MFELSPKDHPLPIIGVASGAGATDTGCAAAPNHLLESGFAEQVGMVWDRIIYPAPQQSALQQVLDCTTRLACITEELTRQRKKFAVIGGDHSCAIGTWGGLLAAKRGQAPLGLIWIDAHLDAHTPETTPSGALHGMPLAVLLGVGDPRLCEIGGVDSRLNPAHVAIVGVRSFEAEELDLLSRMGVRIYPATEIRSLGLTPILREAVNRVSHGTCGFGISIDLDAIDPRDAPGVGSPVANGLRADALITALHLLSGNPSLLAVEIAEFNPLRDIQLRTRKLVVSLLCALLIREKHHAHPH
jgi:arginase